jgi:hypothetical protein
LNINNPVEDRHSYLDGEFFNPINTLIRKMYVKSDENPTPPAEKPGIDVCVPENGIKDSNGKYDRSIYTNSPNKLYCKAIKMKWIGDIQVVDELYADDQFIRNKQKDYASIEDGKRVRLNDQAVVVNTAVSPRLMNLGVLSLMERADKFAGDVLLNSDYDYANYLTDYALNVSNNPFKATLNDSNKQLDLRFLRYDRSYWKN